MDISLANLPTIDRPMSWLVTGGCGFIGTSIIAHLLKENPDVNIRVLDNLSVGTREDLLSVASFSEKPAATIKGKPEGIELTVGDIKDYGTCLKCCNGIDTIIHLAANTGVAPSVVNPRQDMQVNVVGIFNMLEAARHNGAKKFIFASSGAPIGEVEPPIHEKKAPKPVSPYGASKLAGEGYCSAYFQTFGLRTISLRFGNVYGPRSKHKDSVIARFIKRALNGEDLEIYGDGNQTRDFIYIDDLIQAIILSAKADIGGEIFQIATHKETTVNEVADEIKRLSENKIGKKINVVFDKPRLGDVRRNYSDISKAKQILGYEPKLELKDGIRKVFEWFAEQKNNELSVSI